MFKGTGFDRLN